MFTTETVITPHQQLHDARNMRRERLTLDDLAEKARLERRLTPRRLGRMEGTPGRGGHHQERPA